jgi:hypothetical protein
MKKELKEMQAGFLARLLYFPTKLVNTIKEDNYSC